MSQVLQQIIAEIAKRTAEPYKLTPGCTHDAVKELVTRALESLVEEMPPDPETVKVLELALLALEHTVPTDCYSTGPLTGTAMDITCIGCAAQNNINSLLKRMKGA